MWAWLIGSRIGRALGSLLAGLAFIGSVFLAGRRKGSQAAKQRLSQQDQDRADKIREAADKAKERHDDEVGNLSDADLDKRLREVRKRQDV